MLVFYNKTLILFNILRLVLKDLSEKLLVSKKKFLEY